MTRNYENLFESKGIQYLQIKVQDDRDENISQPVDCTIEFIKESLDKGENVLVRKNQSKKK